VRDKSAETTNMTRRREPKQEAVIFINKLAGAERQLNAAIRMTFIDEDELAIHTVAAAAYRVLRDILSKRGQDDYEVSVLSGLVALARQFAEGQLPADRFDEETREYLAEVAEHVKGRESETALNSFDQLQQFLVDFPYELTSEQKLDYLRSMSKVSNFLKHADRDADSIIPLREVDNESLLWQASKAYVMIMGTPTPEMVVFAMHWAAARPQTEEIDPSIDRLSRLTPSRRRRACIGMIREWKKGNPPFEVGNGA
jgi:hypothetical protein